MKTRISKWSCFFAQGEGGRYMGAGEIETFLDFDPVCPGWPPDEPGDEFPARTLPRREKGESHGQRHRDQRR